MQTPTSPKQTVQQQMQQKRLQKIINIGLKILMNDIVDNIQNLQQCLDHCLLKMKAEIYLAEDVYEKIVVYAQLESDMRVFVKGISGCWEIWVCMLEQNQIYRKNNKIQLNNDLTLTQIYQKILQTISHEISPEFLQYLKICQPSQEQCENPQLSNCTIIALILSEYAHELCKCYNYQKQFLISSSKKVQEFIKSVRIMNSYVLFSLLKQISRQVNQQLCWQFREFGCGGGDALEVFSRFVQEKYETLDLVLRDGKVKILNKLEKQKAIEQLNMEYFSVILQISLSNTGTQTIEAMKQYLPTFIKNPNQQKKPWKISQLTNKFTQIFKDVGNGMQGMIKQDPDQFIGQQMMSMAPTSVAVSSGLGQLLVDIDKYKDVNDFFADLSKRAMIGGSITIILEEIPILNYFVVAGGLSYTVYKTYNNQITSSLNKMKQIGKASLIAVGSVGSSVTGMVVGSIVIPIPFLGAFIGGVVGGFLGEKGSRQLTSILNNKSLIKLMSYLHDTIQNEVYWEYSEEILKKLGISKKYFEETFCPDSKKRTSMITAVCFCIVTWYESRRQMLFTQMKMGAVETNKGNENKEKDKKSDRNAEFFVSDFDIVAMICYLSQSGEFLVDELPKIDQLVKHLIS